MGLQTTKHYTLSQVQSERWLAFTAGFLTSATRGCLYIFSKSKTNSSHPEKIYYWPERAKDPAHFHQVCRRAEKEEKGVILSFQDAESTTDKRKDCTHIALPFALESDLLLVGAFELRPKDTKQLRQCMQKMEWGLRWLKEELCFCDTRDLDNTKELNTLLTIYKAVQAEETFADAAQLLVDSLAKTITCERISIGVYKTRQIDVTAISFQASIDKTSLLVRDIALAMEECHDQKEPINYPPPAKSLGPITKLHEVLAVKHGATSILSLPLHDGSETTTPVLLLESTSGEPLSRDKLQLWQSIGQFIGPILTNKIKQEYNLVTIIFHKLKERFKALAKNKRGAQIKALLSLLLVALCFFAKGDFRINADVILSGTIVRGVVAPFSGYVAEANKRAGDHAEQGEILASIDTSDLTLEELTWTSKYTQADLEYRKAIAENSTSQAKIIDQQKKQAEIQLSLLRIQKERAEIKAPFSGIIVTGDLSQSIGGPVERGKLLFEMVPDEGFKILAQVDEKDISFIEKSQSGTLIFNSLPKKKFQFSLSKITPVSTAADGRNTFRVEASLQDTSDRLRPGMKGFGKITIGRKPLIWLWTRTLRDRIRLLGWTLLP